jgi:hypothetical protein
VNVKIRDGNVANRSIYVALAVTVDGHWDILGLWAGEHGDGEGAKYWMRVLSEIKNRGTQVSTSRSDRPGLIGAARCPFINPVRRYGGSYWRDGQERVRPFPGAARRGDCAPLSGTGWALSAGCRLVLGKQIDPVPHIAR